MAKKKEPEKQGNEELFLALNLLEKEKGIPVEFMLDKIKKAISTACKNNYGNEDVDIDVDPEKGVFNVYLRKEIVEEVEDPNRQYLLDKAKQVDPTACVGRFVRIKLDTKQFGRVAAQTARNIIRQGIRDSERVVDKETGRSVIKISRVSREMVKRLFEKEVPEIYNGEVEIKAISREPGSRTKIAVWSRDENIDPRTGAISLKIGKAEAVLPKNEQIGGENVKEGDYIKVYVVDVRETEKGPKAIISRTHPDLVKRMFETEVPEIYDGTVEIKAVSREAGSRTKLAVMSHNPDVDAVGACIGPKGTRVAAVVSELNNEKIDVVLYSDDPEKFIASALSPATVLSVQILDPEERTCRVIVPDNQLSLAIGNKGQNAKLAARLTGYSIDIKPQSSLLQSSGSDDEQYVNRLVIDLGEDETDAPQEEGAAEEAEAEQEQA